ncbi:MAG: DNA-directed RNA polymerase subunit alpha, partial [Candidatus Berkelbacteria bacterium Gr01-1014_85]
VVTAADFKANADVEIMNPDLVIATLDKKGKLALEITCERGRGYVTTEMRREEKLPLGTIAIDSIFTPIKKVHYQVDNTRVGRMTNFDKVTLDIATDGSLEPTQALQMAASILIEHLAVIAGQDSPAERQAESESVATVETVEIESEAIVVKPKRSRKTEVSDVSA